MLVVVSADLVSKKVHQDFCETHLSNQYPSTPRADLTPPIWIPSLRHRSSLLVVMLVSYQGFRLRLFLLETYPW